VSSWQWTYVYIGDTLPIETGATEAQVVAAAASRYAADSAASWNGTTHRITGGCTTASPPCAPFSPRLVAIPLFDVDRYETTRQQSGTPEIRIVNFAGFFITSVNPLQGRLATFPGTLAFERIDPDDTGPIPAHVGYSSAFLRAAVLYR
jgi:hypothetical protein